VRTLVLTLLLCACAAASSPAGARVLATVDAPLAPYPAAGYSGYGVGHVMAGPVLAGGRLAWAQEGPQGSVLIQAVPAAGGATQTLATLPALLPGDENHLLLALVASPTRLAWFEGQEELEGYSGPSREADALQGRIVAGPLDGPFRTVAGCDRFGPGCPEAQACVGGSGGVAGGGLTAMALTGDVLTYTDFCGADGTRDATGAQAQAVHRVDLAADPPAASSPLAAGAGAGVSFETLGPDLAAGGVANAAAPVVRRISDGSALGPYPAGAPTGLIQADGKVAGATYDPATGNNTIAWAAPGDPEVHRLPFAGPSPYDGLLGFAGDRLLIQPPGTSQGLVLVDLGGAAAPVVRIAPAPGPQRLAAVVGGASFDGAHVAWAVTSCEHTAIGISSIGDAPQDVPARVCDAPRTTGGHVRADRRGRLGVRVVCGRPCAATLAVRFPGVDVTSFQRFRLGGAPRFQRVLLDLPLKVLRAIRRGPRPARIWIAGSIQRPSSDLVVSAPRHGAPA
jgi:hypothetical protein